MPVNLEKVKAETPKCYKGLSNDLESSISKCQKIRTTLDGKIKFLYKLKMRENIPLDSMDFIEMARKIPKLLKKEKGPFTITDLITKCEREQMVICSAINALEKCKDEFSKLDFKADNLILKDGKINGLHPVAQKYIEIDATFKTIENMTAASTWRLALANDFEEIITTPGQPFLTKKQLSDIIDRANSYIKIMEKHMNIFRVEGGADEDYISDSDSRKLKERIQKIREVIKTASTQLSSGNLMSAYKALLGAEKGCDILDFSFNKIIEDAEMQKKEPGQYLKMKVEFYGDIVLGTGLPFIGGVIGLLSTGPLGIAPGAQAGMDASALWWAYRGTDGLYHSCAAGRLFSLGTALDLALIASAAKHIPGIDRVEFLRPVTKLSGSALQISLGVGIASDVYDLSKRDWFVTSADKREFAFYGSIFIFSAANMPITKISQAHIQKGVAVYDKMLGAGGTELLERIKWRAPVEIKSVKETIGINEKEALLLARNLRLIGTAETKNYADLIEGLLKYQTPMKVKGAMLMDVKEAQNILDKSKIPALEVLCHELQSTQYDVERAKERSQDKNKDLLLNGEVVHYGEKAKIDVINGYKRVDKLIEEIGNITGLTESDKKILKNTDNKTEFSFWARLPSEKNVSDYREPISRFVNEATAMGYDLRKKFGGKVLDAGCSSGSLMKLLSKEYGGDVWGADTDKKAQVMGRVFGLNKIVDADFGKLPFEDKSFDVVVCNRAFFPGDGNNWVGGAEYVKEFLRILKDDGYLVIINHKDVQQKDLHQKFKEHMDNYDSKREIQNKIKVKSINLFGVYPDYLIIEKQEIH